MQKIRYKKVATTRQCHSPGLETRKTHSRHLGLTAVE